MTSLIVTPSWSTIMGCKQVHTIRCDGHTITLVETKSHYLYVHLKFAATCVGNCLQVSPKLSDRMRQVIEVYAESRSWTIT